MGDDLAGARARPANIGSSRFFIRIFTQVKVMFDLSFIVSTQEFMNGRKSAPEASHRPTKWSFLCFQSVAQRKLTDCGFSLYALFVTGCLKKRLLKGGLMEKVMDVGFERFQLI